MIAPIALLAAASVAVAAQPTPTTQPYFMSKASSAMVNYAVKYRQTGVPEAAASSAAEQLVSSMLAPSQATDLVSSAVSYYAVNGPQVTGSKAQELVNRASSYYDEVATKPAYTDYAKLVQEKRPLFDVNRGINDVQSKVLAVGSNNNDRASKLTARVSNAYTDLKADPQGADAIAKGKVLAKKVAGDFNISPTNVKAKFLAAKTQFVNMLVGN